MPSKEELSDDSIGEIWEWVGVATRKSTPQPKPDVILPYGTLVENTRATIIGIGTSLKWVAILPNGDLVIGPGMITHTANEENYQLGIEAKEFRNDMIFLKKAMVHGTINLKNIPKLK